MTSTTIFSIKTGNFPVNENACAVFSVQAFSISVDVLPLDASRAVTARQRQNFRFVTEIEVAGNAVF